MVLISREKLSFIVDATVRFTPQHTSSQLMSTCCQRTSLKMKILTPAATCAFHDLCLPRPVPSATCAFHDLCPHDLCLSSCMNTIMLCAWLVRPHHESSWATCRALQSVPSVLSLPGLVRSPTLCSRCARLLCLGLFPIAARCQPPASFSILCSRCTRLLCSGLYPNCSSLPINQCLQASL